jgi:cytosine/adenosine deaminase-related metal-dependent hydrolase
MRLRTELHTIEERRDDLLLWGATVALGPLRKAQAALLVREGAIAAILPGCDIPAGMGQLARKVDLRGQLILPGLINAHDHLQFGDFPRLGRGPYPSWREWAADIYQPREMPLRGLLEIPKEERLWAGIRRNVLAGVTTVCHHDASYPMLMRTDIPLTVHREFGWAHSPDDPDWIERYAQTPEAWPFIMHCAEGLDSISRGEIAKIGSAGKLNDRMVLVHAVGAMQQDWLNMHAAGTWVVWCPTSNLHIPGRTLEREVLLSYPRIALGSDSPISAAGDLLDELQAARNLLDIPAELLYRMVTTRASQLLRLKAGEGELSVGGAADLLMVRDAGLSPCESLAALERADLSGVMHRGRFALVAEELCERLDSVSRLALSATEFRGLRWKIACPSVGLRSVHPGESERLSAQHLEK